MMHAIHILFENMGKEENTIYAIIITALYSLFVVAIGFGLGWVRFKYVESRDTKPEAFDDLGFTWKGDTFTKIKKVK